MAEPALSYDEFLAGKAQLADASGFDCSPDEVHPLLLPHQRDAVAWAVRGGRRALFEAFGLGKTLQQLEIVRLVLAKLGRGRGLIVCPLGVRQEFARDARLIGLETQFIRSESEASAEGIYLTNYESVRDGKLNPREFDVISLDEAAVLRGFGGTKTFRELMRLYEGSSAYRFVATATPSPNEYLELLSYAAFLDILDVGQGKTRFFKRDSEKADRLTLQPHMEDEFWLWVSSVGAVPAEAPPTSATRTTGTTCRRWTSAGTRWVPRSPRTSAPGRTRTARGSCSATPRSASRRPRPRSAPAWSPGRQDGRDRRGRPRTITSCCGMTWRTSGARSRPRFPGAVSVWGSQDLEEREQPIAGFSDGKIPHPGHQARHRGVGLQLPAALPPGGLHGHRVQVLRLHPGHPPDPPLPAEPAGPDRHHLQRGRARHQGPA